MKRALHFAWLTAFAGVVFANRRRKATTTSDHPYVWSARPGGHQVADGVSSRIAVQSGSRLGRLRVRRPKAPGDETAE